VEDRVSFHAPDFSAPLDAEKRIAMAPDDGWVRGMFFHDPIALAREKAGRAPGLERYVGFKAYPLRDYLRVLVGCAELAHPQVPLREGLRRLGHLAYPAFVASTVGRVLFSVAGDWITALRLASQAYRVAVDPGRVSIRDEAPGVAIVELRRMWSFAEAYQVGVFEGAMQAFGKTGDVRIRVISTSEVDLRLAWG
jgi:uncharacterized protein (TIGR02265 family)